MMFIKRTAMVSALCVTRAFAAAGDKSDSAGSERLVRENESEPAEAQELREVSKSSTFGSFLPEEYADENFSPDDPKYSTQFRPEAVSITSLKDATSGSKRPTWDGFIRKSTKASGSEFGKSKSAKNREIRKKTSRRDRKSHKKYNHKTMTDVKVGNIVERNGKYGIVKELKEFIKVEGIEYASGQQSANRAFDGVHQKDLIISEVSVTMNLIMKALLSSGDFDLFENNDAVRYALTKHVCELYTMNNGKDNIPGVDTCGKKLPETLQRVHSMYQKKPKGVGSFEFKNYNKFQRGIEAVMDSLAKQYHHAIPDEQLAKCKCSILG